MQTRVAHRDTTCGYCRGPIRKGTEICRGAGPVRCLACRDATRDGSGSKPVEKVKPTPRPARDERAECGSDGVFRFTWDSVSEALADLATDKAINEFNRTKIAADLARRNGTDWVQGHTAENLPELLSKPDAKLLDAIEQMKAELTDEIGHPVEAVRRRRRGVDFGDEIDADRYLSRTPEMWERSERQPMPKRTVWIGVNASVHYAQRPEELLWRGAAALALADRLTVQGYSVGITWFKVATGSTDVVKLSINRLELKAPDAPLDMAALATACCDIGFFRLVGIFASARHFQGKLAKCYGTPCPLPAKDRAGFDYVVDNDVVSRERAVSWLKTATDRTDSTPQN